MIPRTNIGISRIDQVQSIGGATYSTYMGGAEVIAISSTQEELRLYRDKHDYEEFEEDMSIVVQESDKECIKLYKWADDLEF